MSTLQGNVAENEPPLTLGLLGAPLVSGPGDARASGLLGKPKTFALLVYLALGGKGLRRRDETLALFWPESDTTRARNALRQSLFLLKRHLPVDALVSIGQERIGISARQVRVDLADFSTHLEQGRVREALALYRGPLLAGFTLYECSDFTAWLSTERDRVHRQAMRSALGLARHSSINGDSADAGELVRFAVEQSPYDENVFRAGITLLSESGDRAAAAALYHEAVARFRDGLEIALSPETQDVGRAVVEAPITLAPVVHPATTIARARNVLPEARRRHLQARAFAAQRSPLTIMKAIDGFEHAIRLSPDYAEAHAGLGFALCQAAVYVDYPGSDVWARAKAHAARASRLDSQLGEAYAVLAHVTLCYDYGWQAAETLYEKALAVDPASTVTRHSYAIYCLAAANRTDEALALLDRARDETPDNPGHSVYYALCCIFGRRFERAQQEAESVIEAHPELVQAHWICGMAREGMGDFPGAIEVYERAVSMTGRSSMYLSQLARAQASGGDHARALHILAELDERGTDSSHALYNSAEIFAALGDTERALDCLYGAYRLRNPYLIFTGVKYTLDPLRGTKRFRDLMIRMGVPKSAQSPGSHNAKL